MEAMLGRREMVTIEDLDLIPGHPPWVTGSKRLDYGLGEFGRVSHQDGRHTGFDAIEFIVKGGGRHPDGFSIGLIGSMNAGMNPEHDFTHQLHERGKQEFTRILLLSGAGKQVELATLYWTS